VVMSSTQVNYSRTDTATRRYDQYGNLIEDVSSLSWTVDSIHNQSNYSKIFNTYCNI